MRCTINYLKSSECIFSSSSNWQGLWYFHCGLAAAAAAVVVTTEHAFTITITNDMEYFGLRYSLHVDANADTNQKKEISGNMNAPRFEPSTQTRPCHASLDQSSVLDLDFRPWLYSS